MFGFLTKSSESPFVSVLSYLGCQAIQYTLQPRKISKYLYPKRPILNSTLAKALKKSLSEMTLVFRLPFQND